MSTHKHIDQICAVILALCLLLTAVFMNGESLGLQPAASAMGYESRLFDTGTVHTIDIVMDGWESFLETCENEDYASCSVVIDGDAYKKVGLRAKGNTSLNMVSAMNSDRYSFKLEFDHYDSGKTYYGLDKLCLNNVIQDATYMKDYLTYQMMGNFGVDAPLCSYVFITVNGKEWGLYLAVEGVEDAFLYRNYGGDSGQLYKPDSMSFGGGRGNGRDFSMGNFMDSDDGQSSSPFPGGGALSFSPENLPDPAALFENGSFPSPPGGQDFGGRGENGGGPGGGMGSGDVKLRYIDDDPGSYSNIFENAKNNVTEADQARLIAALKALSGGEHLEDTLDIDEVLRYFTVHNFVCNGDSYTGSMVHNYYLYEEDSRLSMIPWDYNLAFGTFQSRDASGAVNSPIDSPVSGGDSRPMVDWIFDSEEYTALYHQYFQEFLESVDIDALIVRTAELIAPYVEKDPTAFYTYEEFQSGTEALRTFCRLRTESVSGQLAGTIPSTEEAQDGSALVDASSVNLSDMGTMNHGGGPSEEHGQGGPHIFNRNSGAEPDASASAQDALVPPFSGESPRASGQPPEDETAMEGRPLFQQGPLERPGENGGNVPGATGQIPAAGSNGIAFGLAAASIAVLLAGLLFALVFQRRKR